MLKSISILHSLILQNSKSTTTTIISAQNWNSIACKMFSTSEIGSSSKKVDLKSKDLQDNTGPRDHLKVTATQNRDPLIHDVFVSEISYISPSVKQVELSTDQRPVPFSFKPGQWVDLFIPGVEKVGGFSMTNFPNELRDTGKLKLAVKYSENPPSYWMHTKCSEGDQISIRVGGDFYLDLDKLPMDKKTELILIAGGVGINPLSSMIATIRDHWKNVQKTKIGKTVLLFSAKSPVELLFRKEFEETAKEFPDFEAYYFVTGSPEIICDDLRPSQLMGRRICQADLEHVKKQFAKSIDSNYNISAYLCGPSSMIKSEELHLKNVGITSIYYENWWQE